MDSGGAEEPGGGTTAADILLTFSAAFFSLGVLQHVTVKFLEGIIYCSLLNSADVLGEPGA